MVPTRTLVEPGLRTRPDHAWRADAAHALATVAGEPYLWLLGALGFALRGGIVVLLLPIVVLPTQVEVRLALGANLGSSGLTPGFWAIVGAGTVVTSLLALAVLFALARIERAAFERLTADPDFDGGRTLSADRPTDAAGALLSRLFVIQALAMLALCLAAVPLAAAIGAVTLEELLRPSSGASIYDRVFVQLGDPLLVLGAALVAVEIVSGLATRYLLVDRPSVATAIGTAVTRPFRKPVRVLGTSALAWLATAAVVVPGLWAIGIAWEAVRATFLATTSVSDMLAAPQALIVALMLAAVFMAALMLAGFAAALRAALWSVDALR